jgi:hypothetical protein
MRAASHADETRRRIATWALEDRLHLDRLEAEAEARVSRRLGAARRPTR